MSYGLYLEQLSARAVSFMPPSFLISVTHDKFYAISFLNMEILLMGAESLLCWTVRRPAFDTEYDRFDTIGFVAEYYRPGFRIWVDISSQ